MNKLSKESQYNANISDSFNASFFQLHINLF